MAEKTTLGPFQGINNIHRDTARPFQIPNWKEKWLTALVSATDVDINDDGWVKSRPPAGPDTTLDAGVGGWSVQGRFFFQDDSTLYERTTVDTAVITGLSARISMCEHWGSVFVTDGTNHWELIEQTARTWGLPVPTATVSPASGSLVPGVYLVQTTFVDADGNEGGTSDIATAQLSQATGIQIDVSGATADVAAVNVYVSHVDQKHTSFLTTVNIRSMPYTVQTTGTTAADPPKTAQMIGPITNATGVFSFRAFLMMWQANAVFRSESAEPHLFHGDNVMQFSSDVTACQGIASGMWIGTTDGLWWVQGHDPDSWIPKRKTRARVMSGSRQLRGEKLPLLQTDDLVALFVTADGVVAGLPDGNITHLTYDTYRFGAVQRASIAYVEHDNLKQLLIGVVT